MTTVIDYSKKSREDYIKQSFVPFAVDSIEVFSEKGIDRQTTLQYHDVVFEDQIYNPLDPQTDQFGYLEVNQAKSSYDTINEKTIEHAVLLDSIMSEKRRVRYSFWDALGDVGGFHDGLVLLIRIVIGPFAAHGFYLELVTKLR